MESPVISRLSLTKFPAVCREPDGSMFYFWMLANRVCYCRHAQEDLPHASYEKFSKGYPTSLNSTEFRI
jgi:hypothetical protein